MNFLPLPHRIVNLVTWNSHSIGLVIDVPSVLLIPASPPGYSSTQITIYDEIAIYKPHPCIPGTQQISRGFGPCMICPPGFKNNGSFGEMCVKCTANDTSWCFGAAINEIDMTNMTNYDQANPYPESPHTTEFEDILLQNIFKISTTNLHCLLISPLFWTCIAIGCCTLIFIIIKCLSCRPKARQRQQSFEKVLSHCDVVGEGKHWLGGLISLSLVVLITFACKFSISFNQLYPLEDTPTDKRLSVSCDDSLFNAKLTSSLQLLSILKYDDEKPIFNLLNEQNITITVQFIGTGYQCDDVKLQRIRDRGVNIPSMNYSCLKTNDVLTISKLLLQHVITLQWTLNGPHFVGALRLCFSAPSVTHEDTRSKAQRMNTCQLFFTPNYTLTKNPTINVKMTKVINQTAGLTVADNATYTGIWLSSIMTDTLTDELLYSMDAEYLRYASKQTTLVIAITESEFYMKNTQEPIARQYEILFSTVLFSSKTYIVITRNYDCISFH